MTPMTVHLDPEAAACLVALQGLTHASAAGVIGAALKRYHEAKLLESAHAKTQQQGYERLRRAMLSAMDAVR